MGQCGREGVTPLALGEHSAHAWTPDLTTVPALHPTCCQGPAERGHRLQRPSQTVAALLLGLDCQALLVCFPKAPSPKSSPASLPLTQAERGSKLRGGSGLQAWLAVPMGPVAGSELAFVRECPLVLPSQVEGEPPMSISWQWDTLALTNASSTTLMPNGFLHRAVCPLSLEPPLPCPQVPLCGPELPGARGTRYNWQVSDWAAPVRVMGDKCIGVPTDGTHRAQNCPGWPGQR